MISLNKNSLVKAVLGLANSNNLAIQQHQLTFHVFAIFLLCHSVILTVFAYLLRLA